MAHERETVGREAWPSDEDASGGTEGGVGTGGAGSDIGVDSDTSDSSETGVSKEVGEPSGESWTDPGSEDITRHSGP